MAPILELRNIVKAYSTQRAVDGISFSVEPGRFFSVLGPSGCGKTTILRMIAGFEQPTSGQVLLNGKIVNTWKPYQRNVSTVFQSYALFPHLTVQENIEFGLRRQSVKDIPGQAEKMIELVGLTGKQSRRPMNLSGGERQRVALARSLAVQPDVLLLDEPLAALDLKFRKQMRLELKALQRRLGTTFLFVTHDQEEALSMSDEVAIVNQGRIEQIGSPEEVYLRPRTEFVAGFLGAVNWIGSIGIRPEATQVKRSPTADGSHCCSAVVTGSIFLGDCVQILLRLSTGEEAIAQVSRMAQTFAAGETVHVCWNPADELRFS